MPRRAPNPESEGKKKPWGVQFREFRGYGECVLEHLRAKGMNAHFVLRVATDRDWAADVRTQQFWLDQTNREGKCTHFMYRGEAIFFAKFDGGTWKFGLKDLSLGAGRMGQGTMYPLEAKNPNKQNTVDTHLLYSQAMAKGKAALEKDTL